MPCEANYTPWSYFAISQTWLVELVTWQVWTAWLSQCCDICKWVSL